jgi:hypothetical protein
MYVLATAKCVPWTFALDVESLLVGSSEAKKEGENGWNGD